MTLFKPNQIIEIKNQLLDHKVGLFPCDTIWGLIGIMSEQVIEKINRLKNRTTPQPFIILIPPSHELQTYAVIPDHHNVTIDTHWPGPVTLIFQKKVTIPDYVTNNDPTIGLRRPDFTPLHLLLNAIDQPLISTSVNLANQPPAQSVKDFPASISTQVDFIFDSVDPYWQKPSQIINCTDKKPAIIR